MKSALRFTLAFACMAALVACDNSMQDQPQNTDAADIASAKASLEIIYAMGDAAAGVTTNITLSTVGLKSVAVSWESDKPTIITTTGQVTRPAAGSADEAVTLTAHLSKGSASDTKTFALTVLATPAPALAFSVTVDRKNFGSVTEPTVYALAKSGSHIYAGTMSGGLLYSDDGGTSWQAKTTTSGGLASDQVYVIALDGDIVFIGTFNGLSVWNRAAGGGDAITNYLSGEAIESIVISGGTAFLARPSGVYYCATSAASTLTKILTSFSVASSLFIDGGKLYAVGKSDETNTEELNVFLLSDLAAAPQKIDVIPGSDHPNMGPIYANGTTIIVAQDWMTYRSADSGASFSADMTTGGGTINGFAFDGSRVYAAKYGSDLWYLADLGANWSSATVPGYTSFVGIMANAILCDGTAVHIGHTKGIVSGVLQ